MQQFTVPQFIDVENQIIGPVTTRQFMIFLAGAIIVAISYKLFDFSLFVTITVIVIILAACFAFVKINGRPFHFFILNLVQTLRRPNLRVWNNRAVDAATAAPAAVVSSDYQAAPPKIYKKSRLAELALIVDTQGRYKGE
jgi:hypothetical protein